MDRVKKKRFVWGTLSAWVPWVPTAFGLGYAFRGITKEHATGLPGVTGGFTEMFVLVGLTVTVVLASGAIVLLVRAFEDGHWLRNLFSIFSICLSVLMLLFVGVFLWLTSM